MDARHARGSRPIAEYALLSDCHSSALVHRDGGLDWACFRRFDAPSAFARLLDDERGGHFTIRPTGEIVERSRRYVGSSMVLESTLRTDTGTLRLTDAIAMRAGGAHRPRDQLLRRAEVIAGEVEIDVTFEPRFDYGASHPWLRAHPGGAISAVGGPDALVVHADTELSIDRDAACASCRRTASEGDAIHVVVVSQPAEQLDTTTGDATAVDDLLDETLDWWERWSSATTAAGPYSWHVERSAATLKALTCAPTGAIVAAPTTSLPEIPGGSANWDYRYSWVRDSTLALEALAQVGHREVARGFRDFVMRSSAGRGDELQIMYGVHGERRLPEVELDLAGWNDSRPVRIGNAAAGQTQLDVYGHLLDAARLWHEREEPMDDDEWRFLSSVVDEAARSIDRSDSGIWELRGEPRHYVHSKVMLWVAIDRGLGLVAEHGLTERHTDIATWRTAHERVRDDVDQHGVDPAGRHFVQHYGSTNVDASLLKLPLVGFVPADDPRMVTTVDAIRDELGVGSTGLIRRFRDDSPSGDTSRPEGVFLLCSLWLVEVLALQGRTAEATDLFEEILGLANDVGLLAEEYDVDRAELLGNFPQAFTHLGVISAAARLAQPDRHEG